MSDEISNKPYLVRAMYNWMVDNNWTPNVQVDANYPGAMVPTEYIQDNTIVLNVHPDAVTALDMGNDWFTFRARFGGIEQKIGFPPAAIVSIFARENGQGMPFTPEPYPEVGKEMLVEDTVGDFTKESTSQPRAPRPDKTKKPHLTIVK